MPSGLLETTSGLGEGEAPRPENQEFVDGRVLYVGGLGGRVASWENEMLKERVYTGRAATEKQN
jgi:hypothetical protein